MFGNSRDWLCIGIVVWCCAVPLGRADQQPGPRRIEPTAARQHVGQWVVSGFVVHSTKDAREHRQTIFLDSEKDF